MATQPVKTYTRAQLLPFQRPELAHQNHGQFAPNLNLPAGQVIAMNETTNKYAAFDGAATNGLQKAKGLLPYAVGTDASGNITNFDENGALEDTAPYFYSGEFRTGTSNAYLTPLVGLTQAALDSLGGRIIAGTLADGVMKF